MKRMGIMMITSIFLKKCIKRKKPTRGRIEPLPSPIPVLLLSTAPLCHLYSKVQI